ncbi:extracellular solute-binding protein [Sanguibacter suarezii]|uniref:extracellular solute-binding protein n=1 Tax=Sanguibacter suarezii TaxID=60921 RepID=UPI000A02C0AB|nr:extracellular solute-binding protein [Sanguibacter suarezii]
MKTSPERQRLMQAPINRRSFLGMLAAGAAVIGVPSLLSACGDSGAATGPANPGGVATTTSHLPSFIPIDYVEPDFPSVNGSTPGFTSIPTELKQSVAAPPGKGSTFTAMTPLWGTPPPTSGNQYYAAVNALLGSTLNFQIADGNDYGTVLATALAAPKDLPDWVSVPSWNMPPRFGSEIVPNVFQDLTPYIAGDKVKKWPNLANIPTSAWSYSSFDGKVYGLPFPTGVINDSIFYRDDILTGLGITPDVKNAQDLLDLMVEVTDPSKGQYGAHDMWVTSTIIHSVVPKWTVDDAGKLVHRMETPEYRAALEWNAAVFASGAVHPDVDSAWGKQLFWDGNVLIINDGIGSWHENLGTMLGTNPTWSQKPLEPFGADGKDPVYYKNSPVSIFSFLKKSDDEAKITELLDIANVLAAPFGTTEFDLISNGVEGVHFTRGDDGLPVRTDLAATEIQPTYMFLVDGPEVNARVQYPGFVEASSTFAQKAAGFAVAPLFWGVQISEPDQYASLSTPFDDLEKDISRGRKSLKDLDAAVATWKSAGGEELRKFYQEILDAS